MNSDRDNKFLQVLVGICFSLLNQDAIPGSIMGIINADPAKALAVLQFLLQRTRNLPPVVDLPPGAHEVALKLLTTPVENLTRSSALVQPCQPTREEKARTIQGALYFRQVTSGCLQCPVTVPVDEECRPSVADLVKLLELLE
jgi:hypothetical protein